MKKILILLTATALTLTAQTFNVSTTPEFRTALQDAAMNGEDDSIILADGTYKTTDDASGRFEYLDNEVYDLILIGSSRENVILSGDGVDQIFRHQSIAGADLSVEKISFIDGGLESYAIDRVTGKQGGAIYIAEVADLTVVDCNFTNNYAGSYGGGAIHGRNMNVSDTVFINNASGGIGGGIYSSLNAFITDSTFTNNRASNTNKGDGGGCYFYNGVVTNSTFNNNSAGNNGGGCYFYNNSTKISHTSFDNNYAASGGGGFYLRNLSSNGTTLIEHTIFNKNSSHTGGGFQNYSRDIIILKSTFTENVASYNYGIVGHGAGFKSNGGAVTVLDSIFNANITDGDAAGFYVDSSNSVVTVNSIFTNNRANGVGAALHASHLFMSNSMVSNNTDGVYLSQYGSSTTNPQIIKNSTFIDNYIQDVSADPQSDISGHVDAVAVIDNNYVDTYNIHVQNLSKNNIFANVTLGFEDAINEDYHLTPSSDLIDAGTSDYAEKFIVDGVNYLEYDYEDNNRSVGANMDIGIYEVQLPAVNPALILYLLN